MELAIIVIIDYKIIFCFFINSSINNLKYEMVDVFDHLGKPPNLDSS
jgi:hypothetical protein